MELKEIARINYLNQAVVDIDETGVYWNGGISSALANTLCSLLNKEGRKVEVAEVPPIWEHAIYTSKYSYNDLLIIAKERANKIGF
ncbi:hypothetical protein [Aeromonas salmonicida]|uniref:hypothetical protein n=1 Tax=Aeromonas salmonicida TaxID=645 RepID=UPI0031FE0EA8